MKSGVSQHPCPHLNGSKLSPPCSKTCKYGLCYCAGRHLPLSTGSQRHGMRSKRVEVLPTAWQTAVCEPSITSLLIFLAT